MEMGEKTFLSMGEWLKEKGFEGSLKKGVNGHLQLAFPKMGCFWNWWSSTHTLQCQGVNNGAKAEEWASKFSAL